MGRKKGYKHSEETRKKMGKKVKVAWKRLGHPKGMLGKKMSEEVKKKRSEFWKEWHRKNKNSETMRLRNKKISLKLTGKKQSLEHREKNRIKQLGVKMSKESKKKLSKSLKEFWKIECDGNYWHGNLNVIPYNKLSKQIKIKRCLDFERTAQLEEAGFRVIRLWESEIKPMELNNFQEILYK